MGQFQYLLQSCFTDSQDAPPGSFQYLVQSCLTDSQDAPPGSFQYLIQSCLIDSQDAPPGSFQYLIQSCLIDSQDGPPRFHQYVVQSCLIEPLVPEDAHPLKTEIIIKAINASFSILAPLLINVQKRELCVNRISCPRSWVCFGGFSATSRGITWDRVCQFRYCSEYSPPPSHLPECVIAGFDGFVQVFLRMGQRNKPRFKLRGRQIDPLLHHLNEELGKSLRVAHLGRLIVFDGSLREEECEHPRLLVNR